MIWALPLLAVGAVTVGLLASGEEDESPAVGHRRHRHRRRRRRTPRALPHPDCPPFVWKPEEVDAAMVAAVEMNPHASPMMLQNAALRAVYPVSPDGHELVWPSMRGDCETIRLLEQRVYMRAALQHAAWQEARADERWYEGGGQ